MDAAPAVQCVKCGHSNPSGAVRCRVCASVISSEAHATATGIDLSEGFSRPVSATSTPSAISIVPGTLIAERYEILEIRGEGGMGTVFKARDIELDRIVALKAIRSEFARDPETLQRFKQELILARQITQRNVV